MKEEDIFEVYRNNEKNQANHVLEVSFVLKKEARRIFSPRLQTIRESINTCGWNTEKSKTETEKAIYKSVNEALHKFFYQLCEDLKQMYREERGVS